MVSIFHYLPEVYQSFFPDFFQSDIPEEKLSTCHDCAMCDNGHALSADSDLFFNDKTKCCTYYPAVPNYLVGGILSDQDQFAEDGKHILSDIIRKRVGVTPYGIRPSAKYNVLFKASKEHSFGRAQSLVCPFFKLNGGNCSIWKFRSSVCSTWFCKTIKGKDGKDFWDAVCQYLVLVEQNVSQYIMKSLGYDGQFIMSLMKKGMSLKKNAPLNPEEMDGFVADSTCRDRWLHWYGREEEFYAKAFQVVEGIDYAELKDIMGFQGALHLDRLQKIRKTMLSPTIPLTLRRNPELKVYSYNDKYQLVNDVCNVVINKKIYGILQNFDGIKSTEEINVILRWQNSCFIGDQLLVKLYQNRILI